MYLSYPQCNPPERGPVEHKVRSPMEQFIRHLLCDVLSKKTLDNVLKMLRKLHWEDAEVCMCTLPRFIISHRWIDPPDPL